MVAEACRALCTLAASSADAAAVAARVTEGHLVKLRRYRADGVRASTTEAKYCGRRGQAPVNSS